MIRADYRRFEIGRILTKIKLGRLTAVLAAASMIGVAAAPLKAEDQGNLDRILDQIAAHRNVSPRAVLPLQSGFARGGTALYITPEVGVDPDAGADIVATAQAVAKGFNANFIPKNFATLPGSGAVRDIFVFTTQGNVLSATPIPAGPANTNANYTPLWQVSLVAWNPGSQVTLLTSTDAVNAAAAAGAVTITKTPIIVECSVILSLPPGGQLPSSNIRLSAPTAAEGGSVSSKVSLPLQAGFYNHETALYITPEVGVAPSANGGAFVATAQGIAQGFNANFIPQNFASLPNSGAVDDIFVFTNFTQGNVLSSAPIPAGPTNANQSYTPLWQVNLVSWNSGVKGRPLTSQKDILEAASHGRVTILKTPIVVECSVIFTPQGGLLPGADIVADDGDRR